MPSGRGTRLIAAAAALALATPLATAAAFGPDYAAAIAGLPDWRGVWGYVGGPIFGDPGLAAGRNDTSVRDHPPYNAEWEALYEANIARRAAGEQIDPVAACLPHGMPRMMGPMPHPSARAEPIEFIVTPGEVWIITEWGPQIRRIYIDAEHPPAEELYPTFTGHSVGHWEGDTLVVDTVSIREGLYDRTGAPHSDQIHIVERIRMTDADTIEDRMVIEDPVAFTEPWAVTRSFYRKAPEDRLYDFSCLEGQDFVATLPPAD